MRNRITTEISVDISEVVDVDVTLDVDDICQFFKNSSDADKVKMKSALKLPADDIIGRTLEDSLKIELCKEAMKKYTLEELETKLK